METTIQLVAALMRTVGVIAQTADMAGKHGTAIASVLNLAATAAERGAAGSLELRVLLESVRAMVAEGREPTELEWQSLKARSDAAHAILNPKP